MLTNLAAWIELFSQQLATFSLIGTTSGRPARLENHMAHGSSHSSKNHAEIAFLRVCW
jgi:hypothetical protein